MTPEQLNAVLDTCCEHVSRSLKVPHQKPTRSQIEVLRAELSVAIPKALGNHD